MRARFAMLFVLTLSAATAVAQGPVVKPEWVFAHDLKVRKGKETDWEKALKVGVELYKDPAVDTIVAITAAGQMAVSAGEYAPAKKAEHVTGVSVKARTAKEDKFTDTTTLFGVEEFKGVSTGQVLFLSDRGGVNFFTGTSTDGKEPQFQYGLTLKVREPNQEFFKDATKEFGVEAYKDNSTGGMVYVTEAGMVATAKAVPDKAPETKDVKKPKPLYAMTLKARKVDEPEFTNAQKFAVEVFKDENTGTLVYISESGSIAAVPAPADIKAGQKLVWLHAFTLKARAGGEADFAKARKFGVEVFSDRHTGYLVYVNEAGNIAVLPKK
jgi:hypothetical protein